MLDRRYIADLGDILAKADCVMILFVDDQIDHERLYIRKIQNSIVEDGDDHAPDFVWSAEVLVCALSYCRLPP